MRFASTLAAAATALATLGLATAASAYDALAKPCKGERLTCGTAPIKFDKRDTLPIEWQFDTGWVPQGSPLEVRITAGVWAHTEVSLAGHLVTSWPTAMTLETPGKPNGGFFEFHYGAEFSAQGKIDIDVAGQHITWTGDLPYVPQFDFEVKDSERFDPWAFEPGIDLDSTTMPQRIATVSIGDLLGGSIPGLDGGFELDVAMELRAHYQTEKINLANDDDDDKPAKGGPISADQSQSKMDYKGGPHLDVVVQPEGKVHYDGTLHLIPAFYISFLGQDFSIPVADIPISFPITDVDWVFDPQTVRVPLPDLYLDEKTIDFGEVELGDEATDEFHAWNAGEALLQADVGTDDTAFSVTEKLLKLDEMQTHAGKVHFAPTEAGVFEAHLTFQSNDPSDPVESIVLHGVGVDHHPAPKPVPNLDTPRAPATASTGARSPWR
jgi:hypothetical protein